MLTRLTGQVAKPNHNFLLTRLRPLLTTATGLYTVAEGWGTRLLDIGTRLHHSWQNQTHSGRGADPERLRSLAPRSTLTPQSPHLLRCDGDAGTAH
jgi:hypothetical protein